MHVQQKSQGFSGAMKPGLPHVGTLCAQHVHMSSTWVPWGEAERRLAVRLAVRALVDVQVPIAMQPPHHSMRWGRAGGLPATCLLLLCGMLAAHVFFHS